MISSRIYAITAGGIFTCWDLQSYNILHVQNFSKPAQNVISFKLSNKVMLVFNNEVKVLDSNPVTNYFRTLEGYSLNPNSITDCKLNHNEKILGLATVTAASPQITLYDTEGEKFRELKTLYGFKSSIRYLDFSTDNYYL